MDFFFYSIPCNVFKKVKTHTYTQIRLQIGNNTTINLTLRSQISSPFSCKPTRPCAQINFAKEIKNIDAISLFYGCYVSILWLSITFTIESSVLWISITCDHWLHCYTSRLKINSDVLQVELICSEVCRGIDPKKKK